MVRLTLRSLRGGLGIEKCQLKAVGACSQKENGAISSRGNKIISQQHSIQEHLKGATSG
jgi:hypothetical protein